MRTLNNRLNELCGAKGVSLVKLATETGIAYSVLYYTAKDERDIRISTAIKIADYLGCSLDQLFGRD